MTDNHDQTYEQLRDNVKKMIAATRNELEQIDRRRQQLEQQLEQLRAALTAGRNRSGRVKIDDLKDDVRQVLRTFPDHTASPAQLRDALFEEFGYRNKNSLHARLSAVLRQWAADETSDLEQLGRGIYRLKDKA